ncbi:lysophosphatidic acid receptor 6-like [Huso huso]|uniref:Lysophosphatidic acid receptor 6-like n=1 Tax=Huso huso TaxID=61971 RepID=A0ABR0Z7G9_HUSHU
MGLSTKYSYHQINHGDSASRPETDPRNVLRRYLLLKYIQYLILPSSNFLASVFGMLGSIYTAVALQSPSISRKSTTVFISHLVQADVLVLIRIAELLQGYTDVKLLAGRPSFLEGLCHNLLNANEHASLLLLSCLSLEVLLITLLPAESRGLRTVRWARLACTLIWVAVLGELAVLQAAESLQRAGLSFHGDHSLVFPLLQGCVWAAPLLQMVSRVLGVLLWLGNAYVYYRVYCRAPLRRKSC